MLDKIADFLAEPLPRKIIFFDELLTPRLIRTLYWLGLLAVAWTGLIHFFSHGFFGMFEAIVIVFAGVIALRVMAEVVMLLFKINENLEIIAAQSDVVLTTPVTETDSSVGAQNNFSKNSPKNSPKNSQTSSQPKSQTAKKVSKKMVSKVSKNTSDDTSE